MIKKSSVFFCLVQLFAVAASTETSDQAQIEGYIKRDLNVMKYGGKKLIIFI